MAANPPPNTMEQALTRVIGVRRQNMRGSITTNGFDSLAELVTKGSDFARKVCQNVRKEQGGDARDKNVPQVVEERMEMLVVFAKYLYLANRALAYQEITRDRLRDIMEYWTQLKDTEKPKQPESLRILATRGSGSRAFNPTWH